MSTGLLVVWLLYCFIIGGLYGKSAGNRKQPLFTFLVFLSFLSLFNMFAFEILK